jgi:polyphenol oxidase
VFQLGTRNTYQASPLAELEWLDHGFGTRSSDGWVPEPYAWVKQIHSTTVLRATDPGCLGRADALISNTSGLYIGIRTADCTPLLIADPRARAVAAIHAGWKGTAHSIAARAVEEMSRAFASRPEDLIVAIGPRICGKCYEVGPEVARQFRNWFPERADLDLKTRIDLAEANRRQLVAAGVDPGRIVVAELCTLCTAGGFHSHRAGSAGRMVSAIGIRA